jgi:hypothetical protein
VVPADPVLPVLPAEPVVPAIPEAPVPAAPVVPAEPEALPTPVVPAPPVVPPPPPVSETHSFLSVAHTSPDWQTLPASQGQSSVPALPVHVDWPLVPGCPQDTASVVMPARAAKERTTESFRKLDWVFMKICRSFSEKIGRRNDRNSPEIDRKIDEKVDARDRRARGGDRRRGRVLR